MLSALGDAVHVLPMIVALKRAWPQTRISWVIQPVPHRLVAGHPCVDEFIVFQRRRGAAAVGSYRQLLDQLSGRHFDLLINLQVYMKAGLITALLNADVKLGFDRRRARDLNWLFTTHRIPARPPAHVQDQYFEFIEYLGVSAQPVEWQLELSEAEQQAQRTFFGGRARTCAIVVGTSKLQKNWLPERYARVIEVLAERHGIEAILLGGPSPVERALAEAITESARVPVTNMLGDDVRRLLWLLDGAQLVISPDTGPLHMARARRRVVIGLYGYTNPKRYGPYRWCEDLVVDGYARWPDEAYPLSARQRDDGMSRVTVEMVLDKVELALARYLAEPRGYKQ